MLRKRTVCKHHGKSTGGLGWQKMSAGRISSAMESGLKKTTGKTGHAFRRNSTFFITLINNTDLTVIIQELPVGETGVNCNKI